MRRSFLAGLALVIGLPASFAEATQRSPEWMAVLEAAENAVAVKEAVGYFLCTPELPAEPRNYLQVLRGRAAAEAREVLLASGCVGLRTHTDAAIIALRLAELAPNLRPGTEPALGGYRQRNVGYVIAHLLVLQNGCRSHDLTSALRYNNVLALLGQVESFNELGAVADAVQVHLHRLGGGSETGGFDREWCLGVFEEVNRSMRSDF